MGSALLSSCYGNGNKKRYDKPGTLFNGKPQSREERIERVKIAALGMQRYDWEQGTVGQAFLEMGEEDLAIAFARGAILRQENGRFSVLKGNGPITDCSSVGEVVLFAAVKTGDPVFKKGAEEMLEVFHKSVHKTPEGILFHTQEPAKWIMSDANYMLPPFLAACGEYKEALKQIEGWRRYLYNPKAHLYSHIYDYENHSFRREDFWGTGNGWSAAGFCRVIGMLPDNMREEKIKLAEYTKELIDGCLQFMNPDGTFHDVVNKPETFIEVNLSQMLAYSIFRGVKEGFLEKSYLGKAELMRCAANERVDYLGYIHDVCGCPNFDRSYFSPEAQAFYLLMEAAAKNSGTRK
ncbi:MAG TPA: glycoside hydrolase family 88 protein [Bacteroidales bacterium]|nr:glycoside hydrolase family 88 protein [Bacteroidales bacterium]